MRDDLIHTVRELFLSLNFCRYCLPFMGDNTMLRGVLYRQLILAQLFKSCPLSWNLKFRPCSQCHASGLSRHSWIHSKPSDLIFKSNWLMGNFSEGGAPFEPRPGHRLSWLRVLWFSSDTLRQIPRWKSETNNVWHFPIPFIFTHTIVLAHSKLKRL
jgi:hypothetical protein